MTADRPITGTLCLDRHNLVMFWIRASKQSPAPSTQTLTKRLEHAIATADRPLPKGKKADNARATFGAYAAAILDDEVFEMTSLCFGCFRDLPTPQQLAPSVDLAEVKTLALPARDSKPPMTVVDEANTGYIVASWLSEDIALLYRLVPPQKAAKWNPYRARSSATVTPPALQRRITPSSPPQSGTQADRVGVSDSRFGTAIKRYSGLPAYLGLVVFYKAVEWEKAQRSPDSSIASLSRPCGSDVSTTPSPQRAPGAAHAGQQIRSRFDPAYLKRSRATISSAAFAAVWPIELARLSLADAFLALVSPTIEPSVTQKARMTQKITVEQFSVCIEALIERHPDLASIRPHPEARAAYCEFVAASTFAEAGVFGRRYLTAREVRHSMLVERLCQCAVRSLDEVPGCSPTAFGQICQQWEGLVTEGQSVTVASVSRWLGDFMPRDALCHALTARSFDSSVSFQQFMMLALAMRDRMSSFSAQFWYRCIGLGDAWNLRLISRFVGDRFSGIGASSAEWTTNTMSRVLDLLPELGTGDEVSCMCIRRRRIGPMVYDALLGRPPVAAGPDDVMA